MLPKDRELVTMGVEQSGGEEVVLNGVNYAGSTQSSNLMASSLFTQLPEGEG